MELKFYRAKTLILSIMFFGHDRIFQWREEEAFVVTYGCTNWTSFSVLFIGGGLSWSLWSFCGSIKVASPEICLNPAGAGSIPMRQEEPPIC